MRPKSAPLVAAVASAAALVSMTAPASAASSNLAAPAAPGGEAQILAQPDQSGATSCHLANGIKHVVEITFDNVHFSRDNPDVPSDMQMLPNLLHFLEGYGTLLSDNHTPLIAHTGDDIVTTLTGLYGDRQGITIANSYRSYNADGTTDSDAAFTYWTSSDDDTASTVNPGHDTNPNMVYSATPPATTNPPPTPDKITPAPWVPFTRAGCNVGGVSTANMELENTNDIPQVFGANSPEAQQLAADPDHFKDAETADYVGLAIHCAKGNAVCANAEAVKYGQTAPSHTAIPDLLPDEPGGYHGYKALFGAKYIDPVLGAGTPDLTRNGYTVTNAAGNLVDLDGNQINGAFLNNYPGFPGFGSIEAPQTLAYMADMLESGVPVVYGYMSDLHDNDDIPALASECANAPSALPSGTPCFIAQAQYYNQAFGEFFQRLEADGITPHNTLFIVSSDEGDHEAGANVGRAEQPTPAGCDGATVSGDTVTPDVYCNYNYPSSTVGNFGELAININGLLAQEESTSTASTLTGTSFSIEPDTAPEFYVNGQPGPDNQAVRSLERAVGNLTFDDPYSGNGDQMLTKYLADPTEEAILHMVDADPARTPTFSLFANPDTYVETGSTSCDNVTGVSSNDCVTQDDGDAWDHGDYGAEINTNWVGFVGPGVAHLGLDGPSPAESPNSAGPQSGLETVPQEFTKGPWVDETDIRPTLMYLTGLRDDYVEDGRVITQILSSPAGHGLSSSASTALGACYKQLNSSVGEFGTATLMASTHAIESSSRGDATYIATDRVLSALDKTRDHLAETIKDELWSTEFSHKNLDTSLAKLQTLECSALIGFADHLAIAGVHGSGSASLSLLGVLSQLPVGKAQASREAYFARLAPVPLQAIPSPR